mmetsp:Transcript_26202/g.55536  ORF Transcript_26202/g.55536 Transcript_26202/m.55536 type:complete len:443 (-) Transcript_26202:337-1665(-)
MGAVKCANCSEKAATYCVDCKTSLCRFCAVLLHHPSTKAEKHSIEEIAHLRGVKLITPILLDLILLVVVFFFANGSGITLEYFNGASYCPALSRGRTWLMRVDANFFFYYKAHLSKYCDWEDSYWRFFMDTWVRGILTGTDTWLLLASEFFRALVFEEFFRVLITPVVAISYSIVATVCRLIEMKLYNIIYEGLEGEQHRFTHMLERVEKVMKKLSLAQRLTIIDKKKPPPQTLRRKRPATDWTESFRYWMDRHTRLLAHYKAQAQTACRFVMQRTLWVAAFMRVLCILSPEYGGTGLLAVARLVGLGSLADQHQAWFSESTGITLNERNAYVSDWVVGIGFQQVMHRLPLITFVTQESLATLFAGATALLPVAKRLIIPALVVAAPPWLFNRHTKKQKKRFEADWKATTKKDIWGDMSRDNPCGGAAWKQVTFSPHATAPQ